MGWTSSVIWLLCLSTSQCRQTPVFKATYGKIQSPQYPEPYLPNQLKYWHLRTHEGFQIQLSLSHLDIKASPGCSQDSLTVHYDEMVLGKFCGLENATELSAQQPIVSPGNRLVLTFQTSDFSPELQKQTGFSANYKAIDTDECSKENQEEVSGPFCSQICINTPGSYHCSCYSGYELHADLHSCLLSCDGHVFDKPEGHLSSPRHPHPSPPSLSCSYIISVDPRFSVILNFTDFHIKSEDTEQGPKCLHDWLQVTIPEREPVKLCGGESPGLIATNSSSVRLDYHTDDKGLSHGWSLNYSTYVTDCGAPEPLLNGGVTFLSGFENQYHSVVQYHCNEPFYTFPQGENVTFTCEADRKWKSNHNASPQTCIPVCGKPTKSISEFQRIIGGREAPDNTIPWQVLLNIDGVRVGGMVIADRWIMTAAHDLKHNRKSGSKKTVQIYMGHTHVKTLLKSPVVAASIHLHPQYNNPNGSDYNNDIALVKLQRPITVNAAVMPICLPAKNATYDTGMMGLLSGFGLMEIYPPRVPNKLRYTHLPVVDQETCSNSVDKLRKTRFNLPSVTDNMFCAGFPEGGRASCLGDKGGPFAMSDDGQFWATGIDSWGVDCGKQGTYRVYTKVANYLDWINKTIHENGHL